MLGHGAYQVKVVGRGGSGSSADVLGVLPHTTLEWSRTLDEISTCSVTVNYADPHIRSSCCDILSRMRTWEHEIELWRDRRLAWVGPLTEKPEVTSTGAQLHARDLFSHLERRVLNFPRDFFNEDLTVVFRELVVDALSRDASPNISISAYPSLVRGDRTIDVNTFPRAADMIRELARDGVDFTMVGRTLYIGGATLPVPTLHILTNDAFGDLTVAERGESYASEVIVLGRSLSGGDGPVGRAGGVDPRRGLVTQVFQEDQITDEASARQAARIRLAFLGSDPLYPAGPFAPAAPIEMQDLIPGATADLRLTIGCDEVTGRYRLRGISVTVGDDGTETVSPTWVPVGEFDGSGAG